MRDPLKLKVWYEKNKEWVKIRDKKYRDEHKEQAKIRRDRFYLNHPNYNKEYLDKHKDELNKTRNAYFKNRRLNNKKKINEINKKYRDSHKEEIKKKAKKYRELNNDKIKKKYFENKIKNRPRRNAYQKKRIKTNINCKLKQNLSNRIYSSLKGLDKSKRTLELVGCSIEYLKKHLESQFKEGMSWDNYGVGGWEIDHIKPCASFDLSKPEEQMLCYNWTNLQPLWFRENRIKKDKIL